MNNLKQKISKLYSDFFSVEEIANSHLLKILYAALWLGFYVSLHVWFYRKYGLIENELCWPHLQDCYRFRLFEAYPKSYSGNLAYAVVYCFLILSAIFAYLKKWNLAHFSFLVIFLFKSYIFLFVTYSIPANFEHFNLLLCFFYLVFPNKLHFTRLSFILMYFSTALVKITDSWIVGTYFTSLELGMPYVNNNWVPFFSNLVILAEILFPWFFDSTNKIYRYGSLGFFIIFHVYSILFVGYHYPTFTLIPLLVLFCIKDRTYSVKISTNPKSYLLGSMFLILLILINTLPKFISKDYAITTHWQKYGLSMIDFNYQCVSKTTIFLKDKKTLKDTYASSKSMNRCGPYNQFQRLKHRCTTDNDIESISWKFYQSINGSPFYQIVNVENACLLNYNLIEKNDWIKLPDEGAEIVGYPAANITYDRDLIDSENIIKPTPSIDTTPFQKILADHLSKLKIIWTSIWFLSLFAGLYFRIKKIASGYAPRRHGY